MKKKSTLVLIIFFYLNGFGQAKYNFYTKGGEVKFKWALYNYLKSNISKTDTSYSYFVSLTSGKTEEVQVNVAGRESLVKTVLSDFFTQNKENIEKPKKNERILIPINIFFHFSSHLPVFNGTISSMESIYSATASGYVFFVRPLHINLAHSIEINEEWDREENVQIDTLKLKQFPSLGRDSSKRKMKLPQENKYKKIHWE